MTGCEKVRCFLGLAQDVGKLPRNTQFKKQEVFKMAKLGEVFFCKICGNEVTVTQEGGNPQIVCCGQPMEKEN